MSLLAFFHRADSSFSSQFHSFFSQLINGTKKFHNQKVTCNSILTRFFSKIRILDTFQYNFGLYEYSWNISLVSPFQQRVFGVQGTSRSKVCLVQKSSSKISKEAEPRRRSVIFITLPLFQDELLKCPISFQDALQLSFKSQLQTFL